MSQTATDHPPEYAPSDVRADAPTIARVAGMTGLFALTVGVVSVVAAQWGRGIAGEGFGYLMAAAGVVGLFAHAARDSDLEVRRLYGALAAALLIAAVVIGVFPHKPPGGGDRAFGAWLPYGVGLGLLSLLFFVPFVRHETEEPYRTWSRYALLGAGALLAVGSVVAGVILPEFLVGPGVMLAFLGLGFLAAYLTSVDTSEGLGFRVAVALGILGAAALLVAVGRSVVPTVLYEGPVALKTPLQTYDPWKVAARVASILVGLGIASLALNRRMPLWSRGVAAVLGLSVAAVFVVGSFGTPIHAAPTPYLVPFGLILGGIGLSFLAVSAALVSDSTFIVLTRRELASYFFSPIAYIVLLGMALASAIGYLLFIGVMQERGTLLEPILQDYYAGSLIGPLMIPFLVPALTMRLLSEERRTGTLEVLLTAPVSEAVVVLSKFLACWLFFMLCWVPAGVYLIGLRVEGGQPFDYRPLLSFYLAVGASGAAFIAIGMVFSALTRNQIVAAVLTFVVLLVLMVVQWTEVFPVFGPAVKAALKRLAYWDLWVAALRGQLPVRDVLIQLSIAVFGLFLTVKILEARKWS